MEKRGWIELTKGTLLNYKKYMTRKRKDRKTLYYAALPVLVRNAKRDVVVDPDGSRKKLCF